MLSEKILVINEENHIGTGSNRVVYVHPEDQTKILKLFREDRTPAQRRSKRWYGRFRSLRRYDENMREFIQCSRVAKKADQPLPCISQVFGFARTTGGRALVAEHVCNANGKTSENLKSYVQGKNITPILPLLDKFFEALANHHVVARDPHSQNILVREGDDGSLELVLTDGFGDPHLIPYTSIFKGFNRLRLMRKKNKLIRKLQTLEEVG